MKREYKNTKAQMQGSRVLHPFVLKEKMLTHRKYYDTLKTLKLLVCRDTAYQQDRKETMDLSTIVRKESTLCTMASTKILMALTEIGKATLSTN